MYLLDTNTCIYAMKGTYPNIVQKLLEIHPGEICISSITVGELEYGAAKSRWNEETHFRMMKFLAPFSILPFDAEDAACFGHLRALLAVKGTPIGPFDTLIAAQGLAKGLTVVTHNVKEFARVPMLKLEDWAS